jgi:hypothetical protein
MKGIREERQGSEKTIRQKLLLVKFQCHLCGAKRVPAEYVASKDVNIIV